MPFASHALLSEAGLLGHMLCVIFHNAPILMHIHVLLAMSVIVDSAYIFTIFQNIGERSADLYDGCSNAMCCSLWAEYKARAGQYHTEYQSATTDMHVNTSVHLVSS